MKDHSRRIPPRKDLQTGMRFVFALALAILAGRPDLHGMAPGQICGVTTLCNNLVKAGRCPRRTFKSMPILKRGLGEPLDGISANDSAPIEITYQDLITAYSVSNDLEYKSASDYSYEMNIGVSDLRDPQRWEMPDLEQEDEDYGEGILPSETPYSDYFPSATHCKLYEYDEETYYEYYTLNEQSVTLVGAVYNETGETDVDVDEINFLVTPLPLGINSSYMTGDSIDVDDGTSIWDQKITPYGFGTLATPDGDTEVLVFLNTYTITYYLDEEGDEDAEDPIVRTGHALAFISKEGHQLNVWLKDGTDLEGDVAVERVEYTHIVDNTHAVEAKDRLPLNSALFQNYPNPFNPGTRIRYQVKEAGRVSLKVFDRLGREIAVLSDGLKPAGTHEAYFDGGGLPSGVYFCRLQAAGLSETRKLMLMQ
jgi:hypothetical protein